MRVVTDTEGMKIARWERAKDGGALGLALSET